MAEHSPNPSSCKDFIFEASRHSGLSPATSPNIRTLQSKNSASDLLPRVLALVTGALVLAASTWAVIESGHQSGAHAGLTASLGLGVLVGAIIVPRARRGMAAAVVAAMLCGEAFSFLGSAERIVLAREAQAAAIRDQQARYDTATSRLASAEQAARSAAERATKAVAEKHCRSECRALLESERASHEAAIASARDALARTEKPGSATPLADRLGVAPWALDLLMAALLGIAANGLGAALVAFGSRPTQHPMNHAVSVSQCLDQPKQLMPVEASELQHLPLIQAVDHAPAEGDDGGPGKPMPVSPRTATVLRVIQGSGGELRGSQRYIAGQIGMPQASLNRALREAADAGLIEIEADKASGTIVRLRRAG